MTPLKRSILAHLCGVALLALSAAALAWLLLSPPGTARRAGGGAVALGAVGLGSYLVIRGLRDSAVHIAYLAVLNNEEVVRELVRRLRDELREEMYLALESRLGGTDAGSRRTLFERYQQLNPNLEDTFCDPAQARRREALLAATHGPRALEVGCATGGIVAYIRQHGIECMGLDISFEQVRRASDGGSYVQGDACRLPFGTATFDTVLLPEIMEHLHDPAAALAEAARVARGRVVISVPDGDILDPTHLRTFTRESFRRLVAQVPELRVVEESVPSHFLVVICERVGRPAAGVPQGE
ncbi:MAG: methyltransferase domain-containing protein [Armatimonadetes bacterium]|nr:methyltransferase domain-containing protein [Armatimonadota bacterium]